MVVPFRTLAAFGLAFGMLAAGYLIGPAPGATQSSRPPAPKAVEAAPAPKPVLSTLASSRPPVPLVRPQPTSYFTPATPDSGATRADGSGPSDPAMASLTADQPTAGDDAEARRAIEFDGYKNVHGIVKGNDGMWHARAMRGRSEISVTVDASGTVSAQ